jgi:hypothetical protein
MKVIAPSGSWGFLGASIARRPRGEPCIERGQRLVSLAFADLNLTVEDLLGRHSVRATRSPGSARPA